MCFFRPWLRRSLPAILLGLVSSQWQFGPCILPVAVWSLCPPSGSLVLSPNVGNGWAGWLNSGNCCGINYNWCVEPEQYSSQLKSYYSIYFRFFLDLSLKFPILQKCWQYEKSTKLWPNSARMEAAAVIADILADEQTILASLTRNRHLMGLAILASTTLNMRLTMLALSWLL